VKSACLAELAPCEATFNQHVLKASLQTYVWNRAILQSPLLRAWHGQMLVQDNPCSKHTQPLEQTALPLQVQIRSCKKSDDICP
jgi:hypothetical protein